MGTRPQNKKPGGATPGSGNREPSPRETDGTLLLRLRADEPAARREFLERSTVELLSTARRWCRRYCAGEEPCDLPGVPRSQLLVSFLVSDCDEISHRYAFLSQRLVQGVERYAGDKPVEKWVRSFLRQPRLYADYVAEACGREGLSRALKEAPPRLQEVFRYDQRGWEIGRIATHLRCSPEEVQADLEEIERRLQAAGPGVYWYWRVSRKMAAGRSEGGPSGEEETDLSSLEADPLTALLAKQIVFAFPRALAQLPEEEVSVLEQKYVLDRAGPEIAADLGMTVDRVDRILKRGLAHLRSGLREALAFWGEVRVDLPELRKILEMYGLLVFPNQPPH